MGYDAAIELALAIIAAAPKAMALIAEAKGAITSDTQAEVDAHLKAINDAAEADWQRVEPKLEAAAKQE